MKSEIPKDDLRSLNASEASHLVDVSYQDIDLSSRPKHSIISPNKTAKDFNSQNSKRQTQLNFFMQKDKEK
jgi:hypothetical protein